MPLAVTAGIKSPDRHRRVYLRLSTGRQRSSHGMYVCMLGGLGYVEFDHARRFQSDCDSTEGWDFRNLMR